VGDPADEIDLRAVNARADRFTGAVWSVRTDTVDLGAAGVVDRDVVTHPGAVAILAHDDLDRVVVVSQYRHPVRSRLWELPAGLCDAADEPMLDTARRELAEETGLQAETWQTLLDLYPTPGGSDERIRIFLAQGLSAADTTGFTPSHEEIDLEVDRIPLLQLVRAVLAGRVRNAALAAGVLALNALRTGDQVELRAADAPWWADPRTPPR
jgi:ADP-ribose pyrophosphatase